MAPDHHHVNSVLLNYQHNYLFSVELRVVKIFKLLVKKPSIWEIWDINLDSHSVTMYRTILLLVTVAHTTSGATDTRDHGPSETRLHVSDVNRFLTQCVDLAMLGIGLQCQGLDCVGEEASSLSLEELQRQECVTTDDCVPEHTGMVCTRSRCDCPPYTALNMSSCSCKAASQCHSHISVNNTRSVYQ